MIEYTDDKEEFGTIDELKQKEKQPKFAWKSLAISAHQTSSLRKSLAIALKNSQSLSISK